MSTSTTHYALIKPAVNDPTDQDLWGGYLNTDMDTIDSTMWNNSQWNAAEETIASATTCSIGGTTSANIIISGTTTITGFGTIAAGTTRWGRFSGILTLTHNATSLIIPGSANITTAANDRFRAISLGSGNWLVTDYVKASGLPVSTLVQVVVQRITATGTYTPTSGMDYCIVEAVGAGGGSGGCAATAAATCAASVGGSSGAYAKVLYSAADIGASKAVTIGAAGAAGTAGNNNGGTGGTTTFGALISCPGGNGGSGSAANSAIAVIASDGGGAAPTISGGTTILSESGGGSWCSMVLSTTKGVSGAGGSNPLGNGGRDSSAGAGGQAGTGYGSGAGGVCTNNASATAGVAGQIGIVIVTEFIS